MSRFVAIASCKGGVGKTTTAINLGSALQNYGRNTIVLDANLGAPHVGLHLGAVNLPVTLHDVLEDKSHISEAIYKHPCGLKIIPASLSYQSYKTADSSKIISVANELKNYSEVILIDTPAGLGQDITNVLKAVDDVILIANPDLASVTDALKTKMLAKDLGINILGFVVNRHTNHPGEMSIENIRTMLELPLIGIIPEHNTVKESIAAQQPVVHAFPSSPATTAFQDMAAYLITGKPINIKTIDAQKPDKQGFLAKALKTIGIKIRYVE